MKRVILLVMALTLAACSINPESMEPAANTDSIAGYWSGIVDGVSDTRQELPPRDVGIIIIAGCTTGKVCGKFTEDDYCPGDIVLMKVDGNRFNFISETVSGTRHACGKGDIRMIDLELRPDGTIHFMFNNGVSLTGILLRK